MADILCRVRFGARPLSRAFRVLLGSTATVQIDFVDPATLAPVVVTSPSIVVTKPGGVATSYTEAQLTPSGTGAWTLDLLADTLGTWSVLAACVGPQPETGQALLQVVATADTLPAPANVFVTLGGVSGRSLLDFVPQAQWAAIKARTSTYDITAALQAAIDAATAAGGGTVFLPAGRYYKRATAASIQVKSNVRLVGEGMGISEIFFDDSTGSNIGFVKGPGNVTNFAMMDLTVRATGETNRAEAFDTIRIAGTSGATNLGVLRFERLEIIGARDVSLYIQAANTVDVIGCRIIRGARDGIAIWRSPFVRIVNNTIMYCGDDGISAHTVDSDGDPARGSLEISGNFLHQAKGIVALGAKRITVSNNVLFLCYGRGIRVSRGGQTFQQGNTSLVGVNVSDNVICDQIAYPADPDTGPRQCIRVAGSLANVGADTAFPGRPRANGTMVPLYGTQKGSFYANDTNDAPSQGTPGGMGLVVSGNVMIRTLPAVSAATDWGYGPLFMGRYGDYSGPVTETRLGADGIWISPFWQDALITDNVIRTSGRYGIFFYLSEDDDELDGIIPRLAFDRLRFVNNVISDFSETGLRFSAALPSDQDILIEGNLFDGDPRFVHSNRAPNGSWLSASGTAGITIIRGGGFIIRRNTFRNLRQTIGQSSPGVNIIDGNTVVGLPAADGFNTGNIGVGTMPSGTDGWTLIPEDCNPQSVSYGLKIARNWPASDAMPTSGYYLRGAVVRNSDPASSTTQWRRLTTGNSHVPGTDWLAETSVVPSVWSGSAQASMSYQGADLWRITGGNGVTVTSIARTTLPATIVLRNALSAGQVFTVQDNATLNLNGDAVLTQQSTLTLICDPVSDRWIEVSRTIVP